MKARGARGLLPAGSSSNVFLRMWSSETHLLGRVGRFDPENTGLLKEGPGGGWDNREEGGSGSIQGLSAGVELEGDQ